MTVVLQTPAHPFLGTFERSGNGDSRGELLRTIQVLQGSGKQVGVAVQQIVICLGGLDCHAAPLWDILTTGLGVVARHIASYQLDVTVVQVVAGTAAIRTHPDSQMTRTLCEYRAVPLSPAGLVTRVIVATHPAISDPPVIGEQRAETVSEHLVSTLPSPAFSATDVMDLSLHRGSFETVLADEDAEHAADRRVSHTA
jgi:hypothetical protein